MGDTVWLRNADTDAVYEAPRSALPFYAQGNWQEIDQTEVDQILQDRARAAADADAAMKADAETAVAAGPSVEEAAAADEAMREQATAQTPPADEAGDDTPDEPDAGRPAKKKENG